MNKEKLNFHIKVINTILQNHIKNNTLYSFKDLLDKVKKELKDLSGLGLLLNQVIEQMEKSGDLFRYVDNGNIRFISTRNFPTSLALVEWQNDRSYIVYMLDAKRKKTGEYGILSAEESENVIDGDIILVKKIPEKFKTHGYEYIVLERVEKSVGHFIGKIVEIEISKGVKVSKCVLLEKNFRLPIILDKVSEEDNFPYYEGDFIFGKISSDSDFERGGDLELMLKFEGVIGNINDPGIETLLALKWMNIQKDTFNINEEIENIKKKAFVKDEGRKDLRHLNFITVDGIESKDLDDALYIEKKESGFNVYIAISDVSYYIEAGSETDKMAFQKNQTYYFPHNIYPMLPKVLSESVLSLNADGETKKVLVCEIKLNNEKEVVSYDLYPASIKNHARLTYNDIDYYAKKSGCVDVSGYTMTGARNIYLNEDDFITTDVIENLLIVAHSLREKRKVDDSHYYDEFVPVIDNFSGKVNDLKLRPRNTLSGNMIEEFMLLANKSVSEFMDKKKLKNAIFRNQDAPKYSDDRMSSAKYENVNKGHYALNFSSYTHFTSPVRRYVDLNVHRVIRKEIMKENGSSVDFDVNELTFYSNKVTRRFKQAQNKVIKWLVIEYLKELKEKYFKAKIISSLSNGWIVECEKLKLQAYISKPKDLNEVKYIESKDHIVIEIFDLDFCKERLILKIKTDKII